jgi:hypothetical protein
MGLRTWLLRRGFRLGTGGSSASFCGAPAGTAEPTGLRAVFIERASLAYVAIRRDLAPLGGSGRRQARGSGAVP